jgi:hypothetical protein
VSSSELAVSTSFSNDDKNEGSPLVLMLYGRGGLPARLLEKAVELEIDRDADEVEASPITLRVRGRFSFRSGSFDDSGAGVEGDAVAGVDFLLFRPLGEGVLLTLLSTSFAFSNAPQALASSDVSGGVWGLWSRSIGAEFRKISLAP